MAHVLDVGVIGSVNRDTIERPGAFPRERLGGVLYTACALAHLGQDRLRVRPLARVGAALLAELPWRLRDAPGLRLDSLLPTDGEGYRCHIRYDETGAKTEVLTGDVAPLLWEDVAPCLPDLDALIVNFITGFELERRTLERIRDVLAGPLLMDVHSLTLARLDDGRRVARKPAAWEAWVGLADVVQMNAAEAALLGDLADPEDGAALQGVAARLLDLGPGVALVTRGELGVVGAWRTTDAQVRLLEQAVAPVTGPACDPTGCGDVFLAGFSAAWLAGAEPPGAALQGALAARRNCALHGVEDLHRLAG